MQGYHVIRIAIDPLGQPISGLVECVEHPYCGHMGPVDVGPFDTTADVLRTVTDRLDVQLTLW